MGKGMYKWIAKLFKRGKHKRAYRHGCWVHILSTHQYYGTRKQAADYLSRKYGIKIAQYHINNALYKHDGFLYRKGVYICKVSTEA